MVTTTCYEYLPPELLDGKRRDFETLHAYIPGTVYLFAPNLRAKAEVLELGGRTVQLQRAPHRGDTVFLYYLTLAH